MSLVRQIILSFSQVWPGSHPKRGTQVTDEMFLTAAQTLADQVTRNVSLRAPSIRRLQRCGVSRAIAIRVIRARDSGIGHAYHDDQIEPADAAMWYPAYQPVTQHTGDSTVTSRPNVAGDLIPPAHSAFPGCGEPCLVSGRGSDRCPGQIFLPFDRHKRRSSGASSNEERITDCRPVRSSAAVKA
jgi:hypothetical protein